MITTPNYALKKIELADSPPDITVLNANWDAIDTKLKEIIDAAGLSQKYKLTLDSGLPKSAPADLNAGIETGIYLISNSTNSPNGVTYGILQVIRRSASDITQIANGTNQSMWYRNSANNGVAWNIWRQLATTELAQMYKLTDDNGGSFPSIANANTQLAPGFYSVSGATLNVPASSANGVINVIQRSANLILQELTVPTTEMRYIRSTKDTGATWTAWVEMAKANNAIVESGTNANGEYIKFGDGTMICVKYTSSVSTGTDVWPFPANFYVNPHIIGTALSTSVTSLSFQVSARYSTSVHFHVMNAAGSRMAVNCSIIAIGRWK